MKTIKNIIEESLRELKSIDCEYEIQKRNQNRKENQEQESRLIFPKTRGTKETGLIRISEQEARFLFVRELEINKNNHSFYYSIETPTDNIYRFSENGKKIEPKIGEGQSASIDVTLYSKENNGFCRKHLIEFKQGNINTYKKDFLKLLFDIDGLHNFYINIIKREDLSKGKTLESIKNKYQNAINDLKKIKRKDNSILTIILFNITDGDLRISDNIDLKNNKTKIELCKLQHIKNAKTK